MKARFLLLAVMAVMMAFTGCTKEKIVYVEKESSEDNQHNIDLKEGEGIIEFSLSNAISRAPRPITSSESGNNINRIAFKFYKYTDFRPDVSTRISGVYSSSGVSIDGVTLDPEVPNMIKIEDNKIGGIELLKLKLTDLSACNLLTIVAYGYNCEDGEEEITVFGENLPLTYTPSKGTPSNHIDEEIFAGYCQTSVNIHGLLEEENVELILTRQVAGLLAYLCEVPVFVQNDEKENVHVKKITIETCLPIGSINFPASICEENGTDFNGNASGGYDTPPTLLTFDMSKASNWKNSENLTPGSYYTFTDKILYANEMGENVTMPADFAVSEENVLWGSCFLCPFNNQQRGKNTLNLVYYDVNDKVIKRILIKDSSDGSTDYGIKCNHLYSLGTKTVTTASENEKEDKPMSIDPGSGFDTFMLKISDDWVSSLIEPDFDNK